MNVFIFYYSWTAIFQKNIERTETSLKEGIYNKDYFFPSHLLIIQFSGIFFQVPNCFVFLVFSIVLENLTGKLKVCLSILQKSTERPSPGILFANPFEQSCQWSLVEAAHWKLFYLLFITFWYHHFLPRWCTLFSPSSSFHPHNNPVR